MPNIALLKNDWTLIKTVFNRNLQLQSAAVQINSLQRLNDLSIFNT